MVLLEEQESKQWQAAEMERDRTFVEGLRTQVEAFVLQLEGSKLALLEYEEEEEEEQEVYIEEKQEQPTLVRNGMFS